MIENSSAHSLPLTFANGLYVIEEICGSGAMGIVYRGYRTTDQRKVAVKVQKENTFINEGERQLANERLADEAKAAARINHPNLIPVHTAGFDEKIGSYIVFDYVVGTTLREQLRSMKALPWVMIKRSLAPALFSALSAIHAQGVVHRDIKPENILLDENEMWRLADFGLAIFSGRQAQTAEGVCVGTPGYVAPERLRNEGSSNSPAADVYAAAVVLVESVTGYLPFFPSSRQRNRPAIAEIIKAQLDSSVSAKSLQNLGVPSAAAHPIARALSADPNERPKAEELLNSIVKNTQQKRTVIVPTATEKPLNETKKSIVSSSRIFYPVVCLIGIFLISLAYFSTAPTSPAIVKTKSTSALVPQSLSKVLEELRKQKGLVPSASLECILGHLWSVEKNQPRLNLYVRAIGRNLGTQSALYIAAEDYRTVVANKGLFTVAHRKRYQRLRAAHNDYLKRLFQQSQAIEPSCLVFAAYLSRRIAKLLLLSKTERIKVNERVVDIARQGYRLLFHLGARTRHSSWGKDYSAFLATLLLPLSTTSSTQKLSKQWEIFALGLYRAKRRSKLAHQLGSLISHSVELPQGQNWSVLRPTIAEAKEYEQIVLASLSPIPQGVYSLRKEFIDRRKKVLSILTSKNMSAAERDKELKPLRNFVFSIRNLWWERIVVATQEIHVKNPSLKSLNRDALRLTISLLETSLDCGNLPHFLDSFIGVTNPTILNELLLQLVADMVEASSEKFALLKPALHHKEPTDTVLSMTHVISELPETLRILQRFQGSTNDSSYVALQNLLVKHPIRVLNPFYKAIQAKEKLLVKPALKHALSSFDQALDTIGLKVESSIRPIDVKKLTLTPERVSLIAKVLRLNRMIAQRMTPPYSNGLVKRLSLSKALIVALRKAQDSGLLPVSYEEQLNRLAAEYTLCKKRLKI